MQASRFRRAARFSTADGNGLRFVRLGRAEAMNATTLGRVAQRQSDAD